MGTYTIPEPHECVAVWTYKGNLWPYYWRTYSCTSPQGFVCEYSSEPEDDGDEDWDDEGQTGRYRVYHDSTDWLTARGLCQERGGDLASVANADDQAAIVQKIGVNSWTYRGFWIGAHREEWAGDFLNPDGSVITYNNFQYTPWSGYRSAFIKALGFGPSFGKWDASYPNVWRYYVCEFDE
ncbi:C-type lectin lectoxin-Lio3-like [Saccoglossus kowalevskii]